MPEHTDNVDETSKDEQPSCARAQDVENLAVEVENSSHLQEANIRAVILAHPGIRLAVVAAAIRNLQATKFYFDRKTQKMVHEPDYATQMRAVAWISAYSDGLPVQTNLNVNATDPRKVVTPEELLSTPATIEAMERALAAAKRKMLRAPQATS